MKASIIKFIGLLFISGIILLLGLSQLVKLKSAESNPPPTTRNQPKSAPVLTNVEVLELAPRRLIIHASYIGYLKPINRVTVSSEIGGTVEDVHYQAGEEIGRHEVLIAFDRERLKINKDLKQSNYDLALSDYQREKELYQKNISTAAQLAAMKNRLEISKYQLDLAVIDLKNAWITAPISGYIKEISADEGEYIGMGRQVAELMDISTVLAQIHIPENEIRYAKVGKAVEVQFDALPDRTYEGKIRTIGLEADVSNRSFDVEVEIPNPKRELLPGMLARIRMLTLVRNDQILIPRHAIQEEESGSFVYVVQNDTTIKRPVKIGRTLQDEVQIISGLDFGDLLVETGQQMVTDQETVRVVEIKKQAS